MVPECKTLVDIRVAVDYITYLRGTLHDLTTEYLSLKLIVLRHIQITQISPNRIADEENFGLSLFLGARRINPARSPIARS